MDVGLIGKRGVSCEPMERIVCTHCVIIACARDAEADLRWNIDGASGLRACTCSFQDLLMSPSSQSIHNFFFVLSYFRSSAISVHFLCICLIRFAPFAVIFDV